MRKITPMHSEKPVENANVIDFEWFRQKLKKNNLNQKLLGDSLDISSQSITFTMQGKRIFGADEVAKMAKLFDTPAVFILAAATGEFDLEREIELEQETLSFACTKADELIKHAGKTLDHKTRNQVIQLIYKIARMHQAKNNEQPLDLGQLEQVIKSMAK